MKDTHIRPRANGFTLIEMMVAVFVVSVMIAVVTPHILGAGKRAEAAACEQNQDAIRAALTEYYLVYHQYPSGDTSSQLQTLVQQQFLSSIPKEPAGGNYIIDDSDNNTVSVSCSVHGELGGGANS